MGMASALSTWFLQVASEYARVKGTRMTTLGVYVCNDAHFFSRLSEEGRGFTPARLDKAVDWFFDHWPEGAKWPAPPNWPYLVPPGASNGQKQESRVDHEGTKGKAKRKSAKGGQVGAQEADR